MISILISIDPGDTSGLAVFVNEVFKEGFEFREIEPLAGLIRAYKPEIVIAEKFTILGAKARGEKALKILGGVELLQSDLGFKLVYQSPSILGVWLPRVKGISKSPHICSSVAHAHCYLRRMERIS